MRRVVSLDGYFSGLRSDSPRQIVILEKAAKLEGQKRGVARREGQAGAAGFYDSQHAATSRCDNWHTYQHGLLKGVTAVFNERWGDITMGSPEFLCQPGSVLPAKETHSILQV